MTTGQVLTSTWDWEPTVLVGCAALAAGYVVVARPPGIRAVSFMAGVLTLLLALISPLDALGDTYLFSAHMLQHVLLILVVPPLLLLGIPPRMAARALRWEPASRAERVLGQPVLAWLVAIGTLWAWHAPALYDAALANEALHVVQHLCFLVTSTIFWWVVIAPVPERRRLNLLGSTAYLLLTSLASSLLGVILTFAPPGLYPAYLHPAGAPGIVALVRQGWGFSAAVDQQVGGLIMWVGNSPIYVVACLAALARWYREPEPDSALVYDEPDMQTVAHLPVAPTRAGHQD
jgi:cytochrome c oxidase assembly factor CtaG